MNWGVYLLLASAAAAQQAIPQPDTGGLVEGRVIYAATGEPIRKAHVTLGSSATEHDSELVATTDETGRFRFANVSQGVYRLTTYKPGFLPGGYGQVQPEDAQNLLKVNTSEHIQDLTLRLFPAGTISGHVLDADGDPLSGYEVILLTRHGHGNNVPNSPAGETTTNLDAEYRFDALEPGVTISAPQESLQHPAARDPRRQ